ncbi:MAG: hypothetical protein QOJ03_2743 [Frankiaceae bacterium]|nr:hypothetical protein [Frankiaceae bacterium]
MWCGPGQRLFVMPLAICLAALVGCGGSGSNGADVLGTQESPGPLGTGSPSPSHPATPSTPTPLPTTITTPTPRASSTVTVDPSTTHVAGADRTVTERDNGATVVVSRGAHITVLLHNTYWSIDGSSDPDVVRSVSTETHRPGSNCVPGVGCGTVEQTFAAIAVGAAHLVASRSVCGEAMACRPDQRRYDVVIRVVT